MGSITKLYAIVSGDVVDLSDRVKYIHLSNDGFGLPPVERITEKGPLQHGITDLGFRLQPRQIQLVLNLWARSQDEYWSNRQELEYLFTPREIPVALRFEYLHNGETQQRQIDCFIAGGLTFASEDKQGWIGHKVGLTLVAPDPTFYESAPLSTSFNLGLSSNPFVLPLVIPWSMGSSTLNRTQNIAYRGTFETYPILTINGPVTDLVIENRSTGEKLDFTGNTIEAGTRLTVDTRYGYKTVTDENGDNFLQYLTTDSDLSTFHLAAKPEAVDGINEFYISGTDATTVTSMFITYMVRYIGV